MSGPKNSDQDFDDYSRLQVLREDRWYRVYKSDDGRPVTVSKFATNEIQLSESSLRAEWDSWHPGEKISFAQAFAQKSSFNAAELRILDFLIEADDPEFIQVVIAPALPCHPKRSRIVALLLTRLESGSEIQLNTINALGRIAAEDDAHRPAIIAALKKHHDWLARPHAATSPSAVDAVDPSVSEITRGLDFLECCSVLAYFEDTQAHLEQIRSFTNHSHPAIVSSAKSHLARAKRFLREH